MTKLTKSLVWILSGLLVVATLAMILMRGGRAEQIDLRPTYLFATGGDLDAVKKLAEISSPQALSLLEKLAKDNRAASDARVSAIEALGAKSTFDEAVLASLVDISQPFVVREATVRLFKKKGCRQECVSATLLAQYALWRGDPTVESSITTGEIERRYGVHLDTTQNRDSQATLRNTTERYYLELLSSNPCLAAGAISKSYASNRDFAIYMRAHLRPC